MTNDDNFKSFFKTHSENVDNSNQQGFWKLTDELMKTFLLEVCDKRDNVVVADFGGGTGRWVEILDKYFKDSKFIIVDLSPDMLSKAQSKKESGAYKNDVVLINSDIAKVGSLANDSVDYVISTYNPISFVEDPQQVVREVFRVLKPGGRAAITAQAYYNALYSKINNYSASSKELRLIHASRKLRWNDIVPQTWQLSQQDIEKMFTVAGFSQVESRGIATITQPQDEDWDQSNKKIGRLSSKLNNDKDFFQAVYDLELMAGKDQSAVNRAMNIMAIGEKK
jgi:ubiquinone/menaquinone biosynthesis C-methylase UbiE